MTRITLLIVFVLVTLTSSASSHTLPWRAGESRLKGIGHCAKGACTKRIDWAASKPHCHLSPTKYVIGPEARCSVRSR